MPTYRQEFRNEPKGPAKIHVGQVLLHRIAEENREGAPERRLKRDVCLVRVAAFDHRVPQSFL